MKRDARSERELASTADTLPAPADPEATPPAPVPRQRRLESLVETLPPPAVIVEAPPPASVPGARPVESSFAETLPPPPVQLDDAGRGAADTLPPVSGEAERADGEALPPARSA